jgi:hypothetical protein
MLDKRDKASKAELDARARESVARTLERLRDLPRIPSHANGISGYPSPRPSGKPSNDPR